MPMRLDSLKIQTAGSVQVIGVEVVDESVGAGAVWKLLNGLKSEIGGTTYFSVLPAGKPHQGDKAFVLEAISFGLWSESLSKDQLLSRDVEEILFIVIPHDVSPVTLSERRFPKGADPYLWAKSIATDGKSISVFFSPWHKDVEIFSPQTLDSRIQKLVKASFGASL